MDIYWIIFLAVLILMIAGQITAATGDVYLSVSDPRPIGGRTVTVTMKAWGFAAESDRSALIEDCGDMGVNDMRFFMTWKQALVCAVTFGFVRKVSIHYRCYAGDSGVGKA